MTAKRNELMKLKVMNGEITVVGLNPCIDWQYHVPSLVKGGMNRVRQTYSGVSGKGFNVCAALRNMGLRPLYTGFNFEENGEILINGLDAHGIEHKLITVPGSIRVNIKLYENDTGVMTELNQPGKYVSQDARNKLRRFLRDRGGILVLSGSYPKGTPAEFYSEIINEWQGKTILDAEGESLRLAVESEKPPYAIKPNLYELDSAFGFKSENPEEIADFCRERIISRGVSLVICSLGKDGALMTSARGSCYLPAPDLEVRSLQGAGDAMVAGIVYGITKEMSDREILKTAVAAASATVVQEGTEMCSFEGFLRMLVNGGIL